MQNLKSHVDLITVFKLNLNCIIILYAMLIAIPYGYAENLLDIYLLAREQDPIFINSKLTNLQKLEDLNIARSSLLPNIYINAGKNYLNSRNNNQNQKLNYSTNNYNLNINQPIFELVNFLKYKKTKKEVLAALKRYESSEQELIIRVAERYFGILAAIDTLDTSKENYQFIANKLEQIKQKFKIGTNAITDVYEAQARLDNANAQKIFDANALKIEKEKLSQIIGKNIDKIIPLKLTLNLNSPNPNDLNLWLSKARQNNLCILASQYDLEATQEYAKSTYSEHLPTINLNGTISRSKNPPPIKDYNYIKQIGVNLSLPIFSGGLTLARNNSAVLSTNIARQTLEATYRNIETNTIIAFNSILSTISSISALEQSIKSNTVAVDANQTALKTGTRAILDLLNAQNNLLSSKKEYSKTKYNYIIHSLKLKQAIGTLSFEDVVAINDLLENNETTNNYAVTEKSIVSNPDVP